MSQTRESTLADPQQIIADLQRANAELLQRLDASNAERDETLEQQTATAEVLQAINSSPGDLTPVFDAILEKAHRLCGTDFGGLQLQDGGKFRSVAERGLADSLAELLRRPFEPVPGSRLHGCCVPNGSFISPIWPNWRSRGETPRERKLPPSMGFGPGSLCRYARMPICSAILSPFDGRCGSILKKRSRCWRISRRRQ